MSEINALDRAVDVALDFFQPLVLATTNERSLISLLSQIGWSAPAIDLQQLRSAVNALIAAIEDLRGQLDFESLQDVSASLQSLSSATLALAEFVRSLVEAAGSTDPDALPEVLAALAEDLLQHLVVLYAGNYPAIYATLELLGLIDDQQVSALSTGGDQPLLSRAPVTKPRLALDALTDLLTDPVDHLRGRLGVQRLTSREVAEQVTRDLFGPLLDLVIMAGGGGVVGTGAVEPDQPEAGDVESRRRATLLVALPSIEAASAPLRSQLVVVVDMVHAGGTSRTGDAGPGFLISPEGTVEVSVPLPGVQFDLALSGGAFSAFFPADAPPMLHGAAGGVRLRVDFTTVPPADGTPTIVIGSNTLGLSIGGIQAATEARFGRADDPRLDLDLLGGVQDASFRLAPGEGDGFLGKVLPADGIRFDFDLGMGWSNRRGLYFTGAASLEAEFPLHVSLLGVLTIDILHLRLAADSEDIGLEVAATASLALGPIAATVERMGLGLVAVITRSGGNVGPFDISPAFVPPRGVGLVINASVVTGGGYILNDPANGRYGGILQLKISDIVVVTAIGLVTTRLPDGSRGFSLLIIITAEFPPIQLGFGFNLSGLGGLLGLNRTMNVQALQDGARTGVLDSILFPVDPVARATKVISDVEAVFPVAEGRFVIGLMARIGWGSPRLVTVDLGIIVELPLPLRIALLGRIGVILPNPDAAVIELHLDVIGILDLGRGELSIDATLHDSRVAIFDIYGDMALRLSWGATSVFVISVGGLNPRFERPPALPELRRLTIALASGENPSVRLESYFAITSNTIQTGALLSAHAELNAGFIGLFTADAYLGFDALITLAPFEFIVDIAGGVVIHRNGSPFIGADVLLTLYGPQPMRAVGYAEVHFLGTHRLPFNMTVGDDAVTAQLAAVDPIEELVSALNRIESWSALPPRDAIGVSLRDMPSNMLLAHPMGELTLRQRIVPLDVVVERFGGAPFAGGPRRFTLEYRVGMTQAAAANAVREAWAPGDFFALTDDEKLSRPSFEQLPSGNTGIAAAGIASGAARRGAEAEYETRVIDADDLPRAAAAYEVPLVVQPMLALLDASHRAVGYGGPSLAVSVSPQSYQVADTSRLTPDGAQHASWVEANEALAARPGLQIVGTHEVS